MHTYDFARTKATLGIDVIYHSSPFGNIVQAVSSTGHRVMRALFSLDADGSYVWPRSEDSIEEDAAWENVLGTMERAELSLWCL